MQETFNSTSKPPSEAEQALEKWGVAYEVKPNGTIFVAGDIILIGKGLTQLPDLSNVTVAGNFTCEGNQLTSLKGAPQFIGGNFSCSRNRLTSLDHAPQLVAGSFFCSSNELGTLRGAPRKVGANFFCSNNNLTTLEHAPEYVGKGFACNENQLTSLEHLPKHIGGGMACSGNKLTSLDNAPSSVSGGFFCRRNKLSTLEGAPQAFRKLMTDFGDYAAWNDVPEHLRMTPETRERVERERIEQLHRDMESATVLENEILVGKPLRLR